MLLKLLQYIFLYPVLYFISLLPFRVLYVISDICYFIGFKLFRYRFKLVKYNITRAFTEKHQAEIDAIIKQFYHNFFDIILETIKLISISDTEMRKIMLKGDVRVLENYYNQGKSIVLAFGHFGNWELAAIAYTLEKFPQGKAVYKPVSNIFFNELMIKIRTRFGGGVYAMEDALAKIRDNMGSQMAIGLIADQNPSSHNAYWYKLLGRETPVFTSIEMFARRFDFPVVYYKINRLGRGLYQYSAELLSEKPKDTEKFEITHKYIELIERDINEQPDNWLWTHNRWKRKN